MKHIFEGLTISCLTVIVALLILYAVTTSGCQQKIVCSRPYILVGYHCCLDMNSNSICDSDEKPVLPQCVPDWKCSDWSECSSASIQQRVCNDHNNCGVAAGKPIEMLYCKYEPPKKECEDLCSTDQNCVNSKLYGCKDYNDDGCKENKYLGGCQKREIKLLSKNSDEWQFIKIDVPRNDIHDADVTKTEFYRLLVGTGNGLFISDVDRKSWKHFIENEKVRTIAVSELDPSIIFVSTYDNGISRIHRSLDAGYSWTQVFNISNSVITSMIMSNKDAATVFAATAGFERIGFDGMIISHDSGKTWETSPWNFRLGGVIPWSITQNPNNGNIFVSAEIGNHPKPYPSSTYPPIFRSIDGGKTWETVQKEFMWHGTEIAVNPITNKVFFQEEGGSLYYSQNNGESWNLIEFTGMMSLFLFSEQNILGGDPARGGVYVSNEEGKHLESIALHDENITDFAIDTKQTTLYVVGRLRGMWESKIPACNKEGSYCNTRYDCCDGMVCCGYSDMDNACKHSCR